MVIKKAKEKDIGSRPTRTLHEAIRLVLEKCPGKAASTEYICEEICKRNLYKQRNGGDAFPDQIFLRARKHPDWFEVIDRNTIKILAVALIIISILCLLPQNSIAQGSICQLDRSGFELLVSLRMKNYESTGDSWSSRAARWRNEISGNIAAGRPTSSLEGAYTRFRKYCSEKDEFMAGVTVGEWVGLGLRAP